MQSRILVNGAFGKMGSLASETLNNHPKFHLVAKLGRQDDLAGAIVAHKAEIVLDLTTAESVFENALTIISQNAHPVIGTSGLTGSQIEHLQALCQEKGLGGIIVPNFSIAAVLMMRFASIAACYFPEAEIIEAHHQQKLDAPSGTALKTADLIADARYREKKQLRLKELLPGSRGAIHRDVSVHSIRLPGFLARQEVIFGQPGETLTITHNSIDRASFMPGVILACLRVKELERLYYGLEHLLDD